MSGLTKYYALGAITLLGTLLVQKGAQQERDHLNFNKINANGKNFYNPTPKASQDVKPTEISTSIIVTEIVAKPYVYVEEEGDDEKWEKEKINCSFCALFITSPCKLPFKAWSKCVEKTQSVEGADFISVCKEYTANLVECQDRHEEFFMRQAEQLQSEREAELAVDAALEAEIASEFENASEAEENRMESQGGGDNDRTD